MIDFSTLQALEIPEGVVTMIEDASGRVLWMLNTGSDKVILEVEKITSDTYAGETTYTGEQFILLDIYPKTNGTVNVTYGGLTKTITDASGAAEPNAQQVFFGTFNGVSDSVATPASGELTIEGDCRGFGCSAYAKSNKDIVQPYCICITAVDSFGNIESIPPYAFGSGMPSCQLGTIEIPDSVTSIGNNAFQNCGLTSVVIGKNVEFIGFAAFADGDLGDYVPTLKIVEILATTPPDVGTYTDDNGTFQYVFAIQDKIGGVLEKIIVPKGCAGAYKTAAGWSEHADYIVEAS